VQGLPSLPVVVRLLLSGKERKDKDTHSNKNKYYEGLNRNRSKEEEHSNEDNKDVKPLANLLIVDDDPDIAQVLKQGFLENGFLVRLPILKRHYKTSNLIQRITV
jgi:hypothetical protein